jgi:hypothetical protein
MPVSAIRLGPMAESRLCKIAHWARAFQRPISGTRVPENPSMIIRMKDTRLGGSARIPCFDLGLVEQDHVQQGIMDLDFSVVFYKTQFAEFVHEKAHARSGRADHLRQRFLTKRSHDRLWPSPRLARRLSVHAATAAASSTRNSRWGRHPAAGTWWRSGRRPDSRSRTGTLRRDRVRLPSKPGRGF